MLGRIHSHTVHLFEYIAPWTTLTACALLLVGDIVLVAVTPDYNAVEETTSQLMSPDARYSGIARLLLGLFALLLIPFAVVLQRRLAGKPVAGALSVTAVWVLVGASLISALATNDSNTTVAGGLSANDIHDTAALVAFGGAIGAIVGYSIGLDASQRLLRRISVFVIAVLLIIVPVFIAELWTETNGVQERALQWVIGIWFSAVALSWRSEPVRRP